MNIRYGVLIAFALLVLASGCSNTVTDPASSLNPGSLTMNFPGGSQFFSSSSQVVDQSNVYVVSASESSQGFTTDAVYLTIPKNIQTPYTVQASDGAAVEYDDLVYGESYVGDATQGDCTITVTQIDPTFEGTFSAHAFYNDTLLVLTNGVFNATYQ